MQLADEPPPTVFQLELADGSCGPNFKASLYRAVNFPKIQQKILVAQSFKLLRRVQTAKLAVALLTGCGRNTAPGSTVSFGVGTGFTSTAGEIGPCVKRGPCARGGPGMFYFPINLWVGRISAIMNTASLFGRDYNKFAGGSYVSDFKFHR